MIGIIDSGSGGLSVLRSLKKYLPNADYMYFGDIKNAPYGDKSHAELSRLTVDALKLLKDKKVDNIVSACNSVSASMAISLFDTLLSSQHIIEMVGPTVLSLKDDARRIALVATDATVRSGMYTNAFRMTGKSEVLSIPIANLAGQIEFGSTREEMKEAIESALLPHRGKYDVLILGCTHYPLVMDIFKEVLGDDVEITDPADAVAMRATNLFKDEAAAGTGKVTFLLSQDSARFRAYVDSLFPDLEATILILE